MAEPARRSGLFLRDRVRVNVGTLECFQQGKASLDFAITLRIFYSDRLDEVISLPTLSVSS